jgi:hypothetical protein
LVFPHAALGIDLHGPLLHGLFGGKFDDEVFDAGIAFPEDLACVRAWAG